MDPHFDTIARQYHDIVKVRFKKKEKKKSERSVTYVPPFTNLTCENALHNDNENFIFFFVETGKHAMDNPSI